MDKSRGAWNPIREHLLTACRWSTEGTGRVAEISVAALGMAVPLVIAFLSGNPAAGFAAALGSLAVSDIEMTSDLRMHLRREAAATLAIVLAALLALFLAGYGGWGRVVLILLTSIVATGGSFSRTAAATATRFILFLTIAAAVATPPAGLGPRELAGFVACVSAGALWTAALSLALSALWKRAPVSACETRAKPAPTWGQKYAHWRRSLAHLVGWSYPLRLVPCLAIAEAIAAVWPDHHLRWIALTVALLMPWRISELVSVKTTQRAIGTALGVVLAALTLRAGLPAWALVAAVGLLAGARPLLRSRNYLAYSIVLTPLAFLIIDMGRVPDNTLLLDRLAATLAGAALVIAANWALASAHRAAPRPVIK